VLISGLQSDKEPVFIRAARALSVFGQAAKAGVPELTRHFKSLKPLTQVAAAEAVAQIDPAQTEKAVEVLVAVVLKYRNTNTQHVAALNALATIGPPAKSALPALLATLPGEGKKDRYVPPELALAVLAIDKDTAKPVLAFIQETIRQADVNDEIDLARQVRKLGSRAKPLMAEIITMLDAKDSYVRECAALTLGEIGPDAKDALPKLKELATKGGNAEAILRKYAVEAVKKIEVK
jgi:HEAT repeat protein